MDELYSYERMIYKLTPELQSPNNKHDFSFRILFKEKYFIFSM